MTATATRPAKSGGTTIRKFSVADLKAAFNAVRDAVPGRPARPILRNVLLSSDGTLSATDLELRISYPLGQKGPSVLLPHARMVAILNSCNGADEVLLQIEDNVCRVSCGGGKWSLPTEDASEFPIAHEGIGRPISRLPADQFISMMSSVKFATDSAAGKPAYSGVLIEFRTAKGEEYGTLSFVALDGRRMCCSHCDVEQDLDDSSTVVPRRAVDVICKLAANRDGIQLETAGNELLANIDGIVVQARLVEGAFPDWRKAVPGREPKASSLGVAPLLHACTMASICTSESSRGTSLTFAPKSLRLSSRSAEYGESSATCDLIECGVPCAVSIVPAYAIEWLESLDSAATVNVDAESNAASVVLRCEDSFTVIAPLAP